MGADPEWFKSWFDENYLTVYQHRDDDSARREIAALFSLMALPTEGNILDIACGAGRHVRSIEDLKRPVHGGDLSFELLRAAKKARATSSYVAHDMRALPFQDSAFICALSLFTSFGYFQEEKDHLKTLHEIQRVLVSRGIFVLDYLNPPFVLSALTAESEKTIAGKRVTEKRTYDSFTKRLEKKITFHYAGEKKEYMESVRIFDQGEIDSLLNTAGFHKVAVFGDFSGEPLSATSPRQIIIARSTRQ